MKLRYWIALFGFVLVGLGVLIFRPVPIPDEEDCLRVTGRVTDIFEGGVKDVVFNLQGVNRTFYVNRGLERGLDLSRLKAELIDREIVIMYPEYWTPLDPGNSVRHISKIEFDGRTIFTEID